MADEFMRYFEELNRFLLEAERHQEIQNPQYADYIIERLELACQAINVIKVAMENPLVQLDDDEVTVCEEYAECMDELFEHIQNILTSWREHRMSLDLRMVPTPICCHNGRRGQPKFEIHKDQVEYLVSLSFTWNEISMLLGVSRMTLYRRRLELEMIDDPPTSQLSDDELYHLVRVFRNDNPYVGESMTAGLLRSRGYHVTRSRIRAALRFNDPLGAALQWPGGAIKRRVYSVPGPNSLWHIDSHHKLIRWRLVTHDGIDEFSRLIVYMKCAI
jgi:hypothetical protein